MRVRRRDLCAGQLFVVPDPFWAMSAVDVLVVIDSEYEVGLWCRDSWWFGREAPDTWCEVVDAASLAELMVEHPDVRAADLRARTSRQRGSS